MERIEVKKQYNAGILLCECIYICYENVCQLCHGESHPSLGVMCESLSRTQR